MSDPHAPLRILMLATGRVATPLAGSELRARGLARGLAGRGQVVRVEALVARTHPPAARREGHHLFIGQSHSWRLDVALALDRLRIVPAPIGLPRLLAGESRRVARLIGTFQPHAIVLERSWLARAALAAAGTVPVIYDAHDVESQWWESLGAERRDALADFERMVVTQAAAVMACSEADAARLREFGPPRRLEVIANGFEAEAVRPPAPAERAAARAALGLGAAERIACFIGSDAAPNREAAKWIIEALAPAAPPNWIFIVAGGVAAGLPAPAAPNVRRLHPLPDVLPLLHAADCALNPVRTGSGSNLKLIEALAAGLPVLTTPFGLRGYEALAPHVTAFDAEPAAWGAALAGGLRPAPTADLLAAWSWGTGAEQLEKLVRELVGGEDRS